MLSDRKAKCVLEQGPCLLHSPLIQEDFTQRDARDHPVGLGRNAGSKMRFGVSRPSGGEQRLREAEAEKFIGWLLRDQRGKVGDSIHGKR